MPRNVTITTASSRVVIYIFNCYIGHRAFAVSAMLFEQYLLSTSNTAQVTPRIQLIGSIIDSQTCDFVSFAHSAIDAHTCEYCSSADSLTAQSSSFVNGDGSGKGAALGANMSN